jgi:uncharacterized protein (DUF2384 family)
MIRKIVAVKEFGTYPPSEGVLARFAEIRAIRSLNDLKAVTKETPETILIDLSMPNFDASDIVETLRHSSVRQSLILLIDFRLRPAKFLRQLHSLGRIGARGPSRPFSVADVIRRLGISQEVFSHILNVSVRTTNRWIRNRTRPRSKPELDRMARFVSQLEETLSKPDAIRAYLQHPNPSLGGEKPVDLLARGQFDRVESDLQALQEGVYI